MLKLLLFTLTSLIILTNVNAQTNVWTWVSGDNTQGTGPVYGTQGIPDAANTPGNRDRQCGWMDASGNLWIFGGWNSGFDFYNDLWKYTTATGQWTWVSGDNSSNNGGVYGTKGVADAGNKPGARHGQASWTDAAGNFWMYGGFGYSAPFNLTFLNDLWMFNPVTGLWTWVSGGDATQNLTTGVYGNKGIPAVTNMPGARYELAGWTDASGNFWIFGGQGLGSTTTQSVLNDLWMFNPATSQWTWVSGDNTVQNNGVYGTLGIPDAANKPGSRRFASGWADGSGNIWIFGGGIGVNGYLNDLWKYNIGTGQWTWVSGDNTLNNSGVYGTEGIGATTNKPGARWGQSEMTDANGNFWFFGGLGNGASGSGTLNDLWAYTPSTGKWTWVSGDQTTGSAGVYGTKGVGAATNKPGGRLGSTGWLDGAGNIWIFGGAGIDQLYSNGDFNDLWKFSILNALPLRDISLHGTHHNNDNLLNWQTTDEVNTARFRIERSSNGNDFTVIGTVAAAGTGNNRYSFTDAHPNGVSCYYRIKTEDLDGDASYSRAILIQGNTGNNSISVYPNPAHTNLVLQTTDNSLLNTPVKLYDAGGRLVKEFQLTSPQQQIDLRNVPGGVLWLQLSNGKICTVVKE